MAKKGTFPANAMRRGEIYWVDIPNAIGHELMKDRPAIIVSCDALNDNSPVVYIHPKGHYHTVEFELNGGHVRESFKGVSD